MLNNHYKHLLWSTLRNIIKFHHRNICTKYKWNILVGPSNTLRSNSTNIAISTYEDKFNNSQDLNSYKKELCSVVR